jgi:Eco57I restriction-modification methylase
LILKHNLYGVEIDERAGALAAFALTMKARQKARRFFRKPTQPNICVMENVSFKKDELDQYIDKVGKNLFTFNLGLTLQQFADVKNFGSLIRPEISDVGAVLETLKEKNLKNDIFLHTTHKKVIQLLEQVQFLGTKYDVVVANPPYMGGRGMNSDLKDFLKSEYKDYKSDLFAAFAVRITEMTKHTGFIGLMMPLPWMFISSHEKLRKHFIDSNTITNLVQPEYNAFWASAHIPICCFTLTKQHLPNHKGSFVKLDDFYGADLQPIKLKEAIQDPENCDYFYRAAAADFKKIPGSPIAYWVSEQFLNVFAKYMLIKSYGSTRKGMATGLNEKFVRAWAEVSHNQIGIGLSRDGAVESGLKWFPYANGGAYRKWYGNYDDIVNWEDDGNRLQTEQHSSGRIRAVNLNLDYIFREGLSWTSITSSHFSIRYLPIGFLFSSASNALFTNADQRVFLGLLNSKTHSFLSKVLNPTLNANPGDIGKIPVPNLSDTDIVQVDQLIKISCQDWDSYERSWDFEDFPLLRDEYYEGNLADTYASLRQDWQEMTDEMQRLEEENNSIFIEAYGLQEELSPDVPLKEITLTCNPHYRYGSKNNDDKLEARLLGDTMKEFISYAVGCMFGRYALEKGGLILANQGETLDDYLRKVPNPSFPADEDNVIPILDDNWFTDDIVDRFYNFLRLTFGDEGYEDNLRYIEAALGKDIRAYFVKDFYNDHIKRYKKRPIYWLFSSPSGSFNALIYMHRYRPDTISVVLNNYLREYRSKLSTRKAYLEQISISTASSAGEKTSALREIVKLDKVLRELTDYENETLYPLATQQVTIGLDDGVKVNYNKFGKTLKKVSGLTEK